MITLSEVRSELRSLIAKDEMGLVDTSQRRAAIIAAIQSLQEIEIYAGVSIPSANLQLRGGGAQQNHVPRQNQSGEDARTSHVVEADGYIGGEEVRQPPQTID